MAKVTKKTAAEIKRVPRGWGYELWIENAPEYCGKLLHIEEGKCCSLHFHMNKMETMYLQKGHVRLKLIDPREGEPYYVDLFPGESILIDRGLVHQIGAIEESDLFEFSTYHEETDSYRVEKGN
jgi:oxalate decarboxylase/phosphoglucose isomerase-like protein (cupin superfamily)